MKKQILALAIVTGLIIGEKDRISIEAASKPFSLSYSLVVLKQNQAKTISVQSNKFIVKTVTFTTSNKKVATITKKGKIKAKKAGKAVIKAKITYKNGRKTAATILKCKVQVIKEPPVVFEKKQEEALKQLISEQKAFGATVSEDFNSSQYQWDSEGNLISINWSNCSLSGDISFADFINLKSLNCDNNNLTALDISNLPLSSLQCSNNALTSLDISKNGILEVLYCNNNNLTALDCSNSVALGTIVCHSNALTALDLSRNTDLNVLSCYGNQLTELDLSNITVLETLYCYNNNLETLNLGFKPILETLDCSGNKLTSLDLSDSTALIEFKCDKDVAVIGYDKNKL